MALAVGRATSYSKRLFYSLLVTAFCIALCLLSNAYNSTVFCSMGFLKSYETVASHSMTVLYL